MKKLLFIIPLKKGMLPSYKAFSAEIIGPQKQEYKNLLKRYGLKTAKVWYKTIDNKEYVMVFHKADDDTLERLKTWTSSKHPFDLWFGEQLNKFYDGEPDLADLLFEFDADI